MANPLSIQSKPSQPIWTNFKEEKLQSTATFETAYHIAKYIRSMISEPNCSFSDEGLQGPPNDYWIPNKGLVIEEELGIPSIIHTPIGAWTILYSASGDFRKIFEIIKKHLNLQPINGPRANAGCIVGGPRLWAVMQWNDQELEKPEYRNRMGPNRDFLPGGVVNEIWKEFCERHPLVRDPLPRRALRPADTIRPG